MAIAFGAVDTVNTNQSYTSQAVTGTNTLGLVFVVGDTTADNITAVTWGGNSMTKIAAVQCPTDRWLSAWWIASPPSASTIAFTGGAFWRSVNIYYTGCAQSGQVDSSNTGTSTASGTISVATTVAAANCWEILFQKDSNGNLTYTPSGVLTTMRTNNDPGGLALADSNGIVGTGSQTATLSQGTAANHGGIALSIAPFTVSARVPVLSLMGVGL